jgi:hypothetical protein
LRIKDECDVDPALKELVGIKMEINNNNKIVTMALDVKHHEREELLRSRQLSYLVQTVELLE